MARRSWLGPLTVAIYLLTAWCSEGFHHPDEHFQILEFASYKLGGAPVSELPWEFAARVRSGLQPLLAYCAIRGAIALGIDSPFAQAFLMRLVMAALSFWLLQAWTRELRRTTDASWVGERLPWLGAFLWFIPYLSVRFSSENAGALTFWSGVLMLSRALYPGGFGLLARGRPITPNERLPSPSAKAAFASGLLLGLSFCFRCQMGLALAGLVAWLVFRLWTERRLARAWSSLVLLTAGGLVACGVGLGADAWLYGEFVFTPYNYVYVNLVQGKAASFGTQEWHWFLGAVLMNAGPPVGVVLLGLSAIGMWRARTHVMTWVALPFVIGHHCISHKELRFLFPMVLPLMVMSLTGLQALVAAVRDARANGSAPGGFWGRMRGVAAFTGTALLAISVGLNCLMLPVRCLMPAQQDVRCLRFLYELTRHETRTAVSTGGDVYRMASLQTHFYTSPNLRTIVVADPLEAAVRAASLPDGLLASRDENVSAPPGMELRQLWAFFPTKPTWLVWNNWEERWQLRTVPSRPVPGSR